MNNTSIGMLVRVDACLGCQACQVACREENGFGYDEQWMEMVRRAPVNVDNKLRKYHVAAPQLDKCAACFEKDHMPLCQCICPTQCLYVDEAGKLLEVMAGPGHWNLHVR